MARLLGRLVRFLASFMVLSAISSAITAALLRSRLRSHGGPNDDEIELVAIFGNLDFTSTATAFRRADVTVLFGGGTVDLRLARLAPAGTTVQIRAAFGGIRLAVPGTWRVESRVLGVGGVGDSRPRAWIDPNGPLLRVEGFALFGGVGVVAETPDRGPARPMTLSSSDAGAGSSGPNDGLVTDIEEVPPSPAGA